MREGPGEEGNGRARRQATQCEVGALELTSRHELECPGMGLGAGVSMGRNASLPCSGYPVAHLFIYSFIYHPCLCPSCLGQGAQSCGKG